MAHIETQTKVLSVLNQLKAFLVKPRKFAITTIFSFNELAKEYAGYLIEDGIVIRKNHGERGPSLYVWNEEVEPTIELAGKLADRYNNERRNSIKKHNESKSAKLDKIFTVLSEIKEMQVEIMSKLNIELEVA